MSRNLVWLLVVLGVAALLYVAVSAWFPLLIQKFVGVLLASLVFITGLFLRRRKSAG